MVRSKTAIKVTHDLATIDTSKLLKSIAKEIKAILGVRCLHLGD